MPCYFCNGDPDGDIEHVPPEVLYPDVLRDPERDEVAGPEYKVASPDDLKDAIPLPGSLSKLGTIIKVPSCEQHNRGLSDSDNALAVAMVQVPHVNDAGWQKKRWYAEQIRRQVRLPDAEQTKARRIGMTRPTKAELDATFNEDLSAVLPPPISPERLADIKAHHAKENGLIDAAVRKISAGIYYAVTERSLGRERVAKLRIVSPEFKGWSEHRATAPDEYFKENFAAPHPATTWRTVISGSPRVFYAQILWDKAWGHRFALRFTIHGAARFWIIAA